MTDVPEVLTFDDGLSPEMARVLEVPALNALYIELLFATGKSRGSATGFVVRSSAGEPFLITNRHVVTGENSLADDHCEAAPSAVRVYLHSSGEVGDWVTLVVKLGDEVERPVWLEHPDHGAEVDVVAIPLARHVDEVADLVSYRVAGPAVVRVAITTELYVIGYPIGFLPLKNVPIGVWTRGTVAWPPGLDWNRLPATLIDCRARPGQSGSPVVFYADELGRFRGADGRLRSGPQWDLVGVYSGRTHKDSDVGIVWKRSAIADIVERGATPAEPLVCPLDDNADPQADFSM